MQIALFGATGHLGGGILNEALQRGHSVVAIVRDPARLTLKHANLKFIIGEIADPKSYLPGLRDVDAAIASISARRNGAPDDVPKAAGILLEALPRAQVEQLVWIGGAASLEVDPGKRVIDDPHFPEAWKAEAQGQIEALEVFRRTQASIGWTYISPAALIEDGERSGAYRIGGDQLLVDANGKSRITVADFAIAVVDRIEKNDKPRQRITVAH
jgi:uncharacterized protein